MCHPYTSSAIWNIYICPSYFWQFEQLIQQYLITFWCSWDLNRKLYYLTPTAGLNMWWKFKGQNNRWKFGHLWLSTSHDMIRQVILQLIYCVSVVLKLGLVWNHTYIVHLLKDIAIQGQVTELMDYNMFIHMNVIYWSYIRFRYLFYSQMEYNILLSAIKIFQYRLILVLLHILLLRWQHIQIQYSSVLREEA